MGYSEYWLNNGLRILPRGPCKKAAAEITKILVQALSDVSTQPISWVAGLTGKIQDASGAWVSHRQTLFKNKAVPHVTWV